MSPAERAWAFGWVDTALALEEENEALRAYVRDLQRAITELAFAFKTERAFWEMAFRELEAHQREEQAA